MPDYTLYILGFVGLVLLVALVLSPFMAPGYFWRSLRRGFSFRVGCSSGCLGITAGVLLTGLLGPTVGGVAVFGIWALLWAALVLLDYELDPRCTYCKDRVNANAPVCRSCGRDLPT